MVFEHKALYGRKEVVPDGERVLPLGQARIVRPGADVTLVGLSITVGTCVAAAADLAADGIEAEVIDLRTLVPLDAAAVLGSVARTGRLVVVRGEPGPARLGGLGRGHRGPGGVRLAGRPGHPGQRRQRAAAGGRVPRGRGGHVRAPGYRGGARRAGRQPPGGSQLAQQYPLAERLRSMEIRGEDVLLPVSAVSAFPGRTGSRGGVLRSLRDIATLCWFVYVLVYEYVLLIG